MRRFAVRWWPCILASRAFSCVRRSHKPRKLDCTPGCVLSNFVEPFTEVDQLGFGHDFKNRMGYLTSVSQTLVHRFLAEEEEDVEPVAIAKLTRLFMVEIGCEYRSLAAVNMKPVEEVTRQRVYTAKRCFAMTEQTDFLDVPNLVVFGAVGPEC